MPTQLLSIIHHPSLSIVHHPSSIVQSSTVQTTCCEISNCRWGISKFAAVGLDEALKVELNMQGHDSYIKTTVVCPYYINTGMFAGVQSKIIPILEPDFVAESAVQGIITNKPQVIIPWWCNFLICLKTVLPHKGAFYISQVFGFNCSMDQFKGRK